MEAGRSSRVGRSIEHGHGQYTEMQEPPPPQLTSPSSSSSPCLLQIGTSSRPLLSSQSLSQSALLPG
ncbi:hypothetical protein AMTR_s00040p00234450 [Amborella trichopoda]|uniref:Uncharacterized protein n=1 Tax=Amborella trichopoda TaxID=13333 RepID=W1PYS7_AMBTC|nr:hypothetical protein AMTR_s00040p00234450 [Amborella trichopoda]